MALNTSALFDKYFEKFILNKVTSGRYTSKSEVIERALRILQTDELRNKYLNKALATGEKAGFEKNFEPQAHLKNSLTRYSQDFSRKK